jgi:tRNA-binding protein
LKGINARGHHRGSQRFSEARKPAYQLTIDFEKLLELENFGTNYQTLLKADLLERQIVAVVNQKQIGKFMSECLVLGAVESKRMLFY